MDLRKGITVYCASSQDIAPCYFDAARCLGALIAARGLPVINGGGRQGLMAAVTDGALDAGGEAIGVIPRFMVNAGLNHRRLSRTIVTADMAERKRLLYEMSIGVIALPGGVGTLEEVSEMMARRKLGLYQGKVVILNVNHFYDPLLGMLQRMADEGFSQGEPSYVVATTPQQALRLIVND